MARLLIKNSGATAQSFELRLGVNRVGRHVTNDLTIDDPTVSGTHCEILLADEGVVIRDLGSTNGTFINGCKVHEARLETGQRIRLGAIEIVVESTVVGFTIPELEVPVPLSAALLADGSRACLNHPQSRAAHRCTQCHKVFCDACVHEIHRIGGKSMKLCPVCSGPCGAAPVSNAEKPKKKTFLEQFRKTLKISWKGDTKK